ncbi:hypothetical protein [Sulfurovum sp.]|uniref:hypothetical protein n=1 Tax=Sulfurovum sp. TaxID=1969726 RepID=UPI002867E77E|nr:hypothetical protein [Sulfurovum sp.]
MVENKVTQAASTIHSSKEKPIQNRNTKFSQQEVDLAETPLFFPEGFEKIFLTIYIISLPYIMGLLFLFFFVAEANVDRFLSINEGSSFFLTWAIGYEIIAALILLWIVKMAIGFANASRRSAVKQFKRP